MAENTFNVTGMTCGHCASSVTRELTKLDGVENVDVNLADGVVTVRSAAPLSVDAADAAITEAGYQLVR